MIMFFAYFLVGFILISLIPFILFILIYTCPSAITHWRLLILIFILLLMNKYPAQYLFILQNLLFWQNFTAVELLNGVGTWTSNLFLICIYLEMVCTLPHGKWIELGSNQYEANKIRLYTVNYAVSNKQYIFYTALCQMFITNFGLEPTNRWLITFLQVFGFKTYDTHWDKMFVCHGT